MSRVKPRGWFLSVEVDLTDEEHSILEEILHHWWQSYVLEPGKARLDIRLSEVQSARFLSITLDERAPDANRDGLQVFEMTGNGTLAEQLRHFLETWRSVPAVRGAPPVWLDWAALQEKDRRSRVEASRRLELQALQRELEVHRHVLRSMGIVCTGRRCDSQAEDDRCDTCRAFAEAERAIPPVAES